jgi:DNA-binding MarR family transcriptional regulator
MARRFDAAFRRLDLTNRQFSLRMGAQHWQAPPPIGAVVSLLAINGTTLTAALKLLERRHLVEVNADPKDKRRRLLELTPERPELLTRALPIWNATRGEIEPLLRKGAPRRLREELRALA